MSCESLRVFARSQRGFARLLEPRKIAFHSAIDEIEIHTKIVVNKNVPKSSQAFPIHIRPRLRNGFAKPLTRFCKRLKIADNAILDQR